MLCADGGLIVGSSSLTNRMWTGELLYWSSCSRDRELSERDARALLDSGVSDVKWINGATRRFVAACDSGFHRLQTILQLKYEFVGAILCSNDWQWHVSIYVMH